jgi:hypothetical protein
MGSGNEFGWKMELCISGIENVKERRIEGIRPFGTDREEREMIAGGEVWK